MRSKPLPDFFLRYPVCVLIHGVTRIGAFEVFKKGFKFLAYAGVIDALTTLYVG